MIIERYTRPYREPISDALPADYFELTAVVAEGKEIMNAERYFSSKIYVMYCPKCDSAELEFFGDNSVKCSRCHEVQSIKLGSRIPVK